MSFYYINVETKIYTFFSDLKKMTSPANEFLLYKCRKNRKMKTLIYFFKSEKFTSPANEFLLDRIEWKNAQVLLMSFFYKCIAKKCTSLSNEFLLHACGQTDSGTAGQTDKRTYIYPRYTNVIVPSYLGYVGLIICVKKI